MKEKKDTLLGFLSNPVIVSVPTYKYLGKCIVKNKICFLNFTSYIKIKNDIIEIYSIITPNKLIQLHINDY